MIASAMPAAGLVADRLLVVAGRELDDRVQAGGDPADGGLGERVGECGDHDVASCVVAGPHAAQVTVELATREEVGERELVDSLAALVGQALRVR